MAKNNFWIKSPWYDSVFILGPPFFCLLLIGLFPAFFNTNGMSEWTWFFLIVCIDVSHVYSTIYRTYMDKEVLSNNKLLFYLSPLILYVVGVILHSINPLFFWRTLAYFAVFHFIRQQYGFMRLYARTEGYSKWHQLDTLVIYSATIYPILYWHIKGPQLFNWFIENDFFYFQIPLLLPLLNILYAIVLLAYLVKEIVFGIRLKSINIPKNLLILGTVLSWYVGIVYLKGDLTFTLLNVVSHGVPYFALVWAYGNKSKGGTTGALSKIFKPVNLYLFFAVLIALAYVEELFWDGLVWRDHFNIFPSSFVLPDLSENELLLSLLIPLLALPQILHYFIDGFIWKIRNDKMGWMKYPLK